MNGRSQDMGLVVFVVEDGHQPDEGRERFAKRDGVHVDRVTANHAAGFEFADALEHRGGGQTDFRRNGGVGHPRIALEQVEYFAIRLV